MMILDYCAGGTLDRRALDFRKPSETFRMPSETLQSKSPETQKIDFRKPSETFRMPSDTLQSRSDSLHSLEKAFEDLMKVFGYTRHN